MTTQSTKPVMPTDHTAEVVERLLSQARNESRISQSMAEAKSLRQEGNSEGRTDLYMWSKPEETVSGKAAALIQHQQAENKKLVERIAELEAGLEPFARYADGIGYFAGPSSPFYMSFQSSVVGERTVTEEDFARARSLLTPETDHAG